MTQHFARNKLLTLCLNLKDQEIRNKAIEILANLVPCRQKDNVLAQSLIEHVSLNDENHYFFDEL